MDIKHNGVVWFAHGKESGPWGVKIKRLAAIAKNIGFAVESPDYRFSMNPDERIEYLLSLQIKGHPLVMVGSSMGGYVSAHASKTLKPNLLFLLAPALYMPGYDEEPLAQADRFVVIHGKHDDIVPPASAIRFSETFNADLHIIDSGHTLTDKIPFLEYLFSDALQKVLKKME